ncbi:phosphosulfolactate synthase [Nocardioides hungaricus]
MSVAPDFLTLPERSTKPRSAGLTHVLDKGYSPDRVESALRSYGAWVDVWKLGWGTAYVEPHLAEKVRLLRDHGVRLCTGGTLLEIAWVQGRTEELFEWVTLAGFDCVEVSRGATMLPLDEKHRLVERARSLGFEVFAEIGSKDPEEPVSASAWAAEAEADLAAGASWVVAEGRESGTVGLYDGTGAVREDLLDELAALPHAGRIVYEAPQRSQQAVLIRRLGSEVGLGNIALDDLMSLETLRRGLRSDTLCHTRALEESGHGH